MNIYLFKYNNYYNRIIKKYETIDEYLENANEYTIKSGVNFNPNDNVNTELTINITDGFAPDYLIVENPEIGEFTRWFVIDSTRLRGQQYRFILRHDLVADNLDAILDADCFVEKAILNDDNHLIFNNENITVNQIKTNEWKLKDNTDCAWICGYYSDTTDTELEDDILMQVEFTDSVSYDEYINQSLDDWEYKDGAIVAENYTIYSSLNPKSKGITAVYQTKFNQDLSIATSNIAIFPASSYADTYLRSKVNLPASSVNTSTTNTVMGGTNEVPYRGFPTPFVIGDGFFNNSEDIISVLKSYDNAITVKDASNIYKYNNKRVKFINSGGIAEYYKLKITDSPLESSFIAISRTETPSLWEELYSTFGVYAKEDNQSAKNYFYVEIQRKKIDITYEKIEYGIYNCDIHAGRNKLLDAPYRMFCLPYPIDSTIYISDGVNNISQSASLSMNIANALSAKYSGSKRIFDIQILPYCPLFNIQTQTKGQLNIEEQGLSYDIIYYKPSIDAEEPTVVGYIFYPQSSSFTLRIPFNEYTLENVKLSNEVDMLRLVSPNYNGQFEFNPARNNGIEEFNIDCTYIPYQPYIHVNPNFGGLYGKDFDDARGLICDGDFSMTQINDAWETYQIQNKNYQNIFNRDIQNLELHQNVSRSKEVLSSLIGAYSGAISGSKRATKKYGPEAAAIGAAVGGGTSLIGGIIDYQMNERLRNEALDYKNDMFGYQLGNIQALPQSISKTTAFTYNNKYFPIVEYYTCTDVEKEAVSNKIAYNSMTVMAIGKLRDYVNNIWSYKNITSKGYIKGSLIKLDIFDDFHIANEISNELYKGVYIQ